MNKKRIFGLIIAISTLTLTGCGGGDTTDSANGGATGSGQVGYEGADFNINVPTDWEVLDENDFTSQVPGETRVAFRSNFKNESFTANLNVGQKNVGEDVSSEDFAKSNLAVAKKNLLGFEQISMETFPVVKGDDEELEGVLIQFQGKRVATDPIVQFKQISIVDNGIGYTVTSAFLTNEDESIVKQLDQMLDSFSLRP